MKAHIIKKDKELEVDEYTYHSIPGIEREYISLEKKKMTKKPIIPFQIIEALVWL